VEEEVDALGLAGYLNGERNSAALSSLPKDYLYKEVTKNEKERERGRKIKSEKKKTLPEASINCGRVI